MYGALPRLVECSWRFDLQLPVSPGYCPAGRQLIAAQGSPCIVWTCHMVPAGITTCRTQKAGLRDWAAARRAVCWCHLAGTYPHTMEHIKQ